MGIAVPFSTTQPAGYEWFNDEPRFDPEGQGRGNPAPASLEDVGTLGP